MTAYCSPLVISVWVNYRLLGNGTATPSVWVREGTTGMQNDERCQERRTISQQEAVLIGREQGVAADRDRGIVWLNLLTHKLGD